MAWTPVAGTLPQYQKSDGTLASGYYLKFYKSGTSTPFSMATDDTGGTTLAKSQLNSSGYPTSDGSAEFIPYVDQKYKIALYQNSTDADADTLANADWVVDTLPQTQTSSSDAWSLYTETPTRTADGVFTVTGDRTTTFTVGTRLRFTDNGNTYYGIVVASAYTTLTTVTCLVDNVLTANLTDVYTELASDAGQTKVIHVDARTYLATADTTFTKTLKFDDGGIINMQSNAITFSGSPTIKAGLHQIFSNLGTVTGRCKLNAIYPEWFGAVGDDDKAAFADTVTFAEGITGAARILLTQDYRLSVTKGTNDKWGFNIKGDDITVELLEGATLRRSSTDISTYALSFPLLLVGTPDSDVAAATKNFKLKGGEFIGEDTRHATGGSALMDGRQAIWIKNTDGARILHNRFTSIDSGAIYIQRPGSYDYENSAYYNKTTSKNIKIIGNEFIAESHTTAGRALIHAINANADRVQVHHNEFQYCDVCINSDTTYDDYGDLTTDQFTDSNLSALVNRVGRNLNFSNNTIYNSSEHSIYVNSMLATIANNTIEIDDVATCNTVQIQIRGRGVTCTGNTMTGVHSAASITTGSKDVTFATNVIHCAGDPEGGVINVQGQGLTTYIDNRSDYFGSYIRQENIKVIGNTITMSTASQTYGTGIRIYSDSSDANYNTDMQQVNIDVTSNTINNCKYGVVFISNLSRNIAIKGNVFNGKPFTESGFTTGTTMNSLAVLAIDDSITSSGGNIEFDGNRCYGFEYILYDYGGAGGAGTMRGPFGTRVNRFRYVKYWDTAAFIAPDRNSMMLLNKGQAFLDRTGWTTQDAILNSISDGTSSSELYSMIRIVGSGDTRAYYDDVGGYNAL